VEHDQGTTKKIKYNNMSKSKSLVEDLFDGWAHVYQESNRVALHWMEEEYLKTKRKNNVTKDKNNDQRISKDEETQRLRGGPNDGTSQLDTSVGLEQGASQDNEERDANKDRKQRNTSS
jgi:hypothetical protein